MTRSKTIIIYDLPGTDEQRNNLAPHLSPEQLLELNAALLSDTIDRFASNGSHHPVIFAHTEERAEILRGKYPGLDVREQSGETPGGRLYNAFLDAFEEGAKHVFLLGSCVPTIPGRVVQSAFTLLDAFEDAVVLAPTTQGSMYGLGLRRLNSDLFGGVDFTSPDVFEEIVRRISPDDTALYILPSWHGLRSLEDLKQLQSEIMNGAPERAGTRHVSAFLGTLDQSFMTQESD